ncbi:hypothetical protein ambt_00225 [Alteromonas naphthalenivorans]|uniref:Uncharacterized protein n=1 Tax=Alteromonas naphthalenivorans TaxID=715451 RepID=F5Z9Z3_ALTNA|nr:hypothetical protein ambt_00225 [Alteromonas naphthalenivorans]
MIEVFDWHFRLGELRKICDLFDSLINKSIFNLTPKG